MAILGTMRYLRAAIGLVSILAIAAIAQTPADSVELPVKWQKGDLLLSASVNGSAPLKFKVDTGFGLTTLEPHLAESLHLQKAGRLSIDGIAGTTRVDTFRGAEFDFKGTKFGPRRVAGLGSEEKPGNRTRDGILGADFFRRFVVEIDIPNRRVILHQPSSFAHSGSGEVVPLHFKRDTPIIQATLMTQAGEVNAHFEIDTGCDDCLCLGRDFVAEHRLLEPKSSANAGARRGVGGSAAIQHGSVPELRLGTLVVKKPSANFFLEGSPAGDGQAGHIGLGALRQFKMIFDYSRRQMILQALN